MHEALAGDQQAFEALVNRYQHTLFGLIYRYVGEYHEAHDVLKQVCSNCICLYQRCTLREGVGEGDRAGETQGESVPATAEAVPDADIVVMH